MDMRITFSTMVNNALTSNRQQADRLGVLQQQASSGKQLLEPSDDPMAMASWLSTKAQDQRLSMYLTNLQDARSTLNTSVSTLTDVGNLLNQVSQTAQEASQSGNSLSAMAAYASQIDSIFNQLLGLANTKDGSRYLFGGTATGTVPFVVNKATNTVGYTGATEAGTVLISQQQTVATLLSGKDVFQTKHRGKTTFTGNAGVAPGTGTDSGTGQSNLLVSHTNTVFAAGSGVQPGTGSAMGDTIIGPAGSHELTIVDTSGTGSSGTVSLNGGPPVSFSNTDTNLKVNGPKGETVYLDTSVIIAGFNGTVPITANGKLSTDDGVTSVAIDFSGNQVITDSATDAVTNVDSSGIRSVGATHLDYSGSYDVFQIVQALHDDLTNKNSLTESQQLAAISGRLSELDRIHTAVLTTMGTQSASLQRLDGIESRLQNTQLEERKRIGILEGDDLSTIVINLQAQQNLLQLTQLTTKKIFDQSLLDFLR